MTTELEHAHTPRAVAERLARDPDPSYLRDALFGAIDGTVTTFAVVAGVAGASLSSGIVIVLGLANLIADGFSMAASNFAATRSEIAENDRLSAMERKHIRLAPEGERREVAEIFKRFGFSGRDLERAVEIVTSDEDRWVQFMLTEEHGIALARRSALRAGLVTFVGFGVAGAVPLAPYLLGLQQAFFWSAITTAATFAATGWFLAIYTHEIRWRSGLRTLIIGSIAATLAYGAGRLLEGLL